MENSGPITWSEMAVVATAISGTVAALIAAVAWLWRERVREKSETDERFEVVRRDIRDFQVNVAKDYATRDTVMQVEERLSKTMTIGFAQLRDQFRDMIEVLKR